MAFIVPKCDHGVAMVQLFYHDSWVCKCGDAVKATPHESNWYAVSCSEKYLLLHCGNSYRLPPYADAFKSSKECRAKISACGHPPGYTWLLVEIDSDGVVQGWETITE